MEGRPTSTRSVGAGRGAVRPSRSTVQSAPVRARATVPGSSTGTFRRRPITRVESDDEAVMDNSDDSDYVDPDTYAPAPTTTRATKLRQLERLGFSRDSADRALRKAANDVEKAAVYLVSGVKCPFECGEVFVGILKQRELEAHITERHGI